MNEFQNNQMNGSENNNEPHTETQTEQTMNAQNQTPSANENLYAQKNENQNAAYAQSEAFHKETPYQNEAPLNGNANTGNPQTYANTQNNPNQQNPAYFNPYTGQPYTQAAAEPSQNQNGHPKKEKREKKSGGFFRKIAATVALALIFGLVSGAVILGMSGIARTAGGQSGEQQQSDNGNPSISGSDIDNGSGGLNAASSDDLKSAAALFEDALKKAELETEGNLTVPQINIIMEPAMVSIKCIGKTTINSIFGAQTYQTASSGSGIIVGANETELLIVTNNHVIDGADEISVLFVNEDSDTALVKGTDSLNDLAIIVVKLEDIAPETMQAIAYAELGDSDALVVGESVVAIGNALGYGQSVTTGCVSALNRAVTDSNKNTAYLIQTDAAINPGNSGGALVNMKGQVIGINSSKYSSEEIEGMGFAIPINTALPILEELMTRTTRVVVDDPAKTAYLGITPQNVSSAMAAAYNMPVGVFVQSVAKGSAADKAGILQGDIITKFDHETVTNATGLQKLLSYYEAGETVEIIVQRYERGEYVETPLTIKLDVRPANENMDESNEENAAPSWKDYFGN